MDHPVCLCVLWTSTDRETTVAEVAGWRTLLRPVASLLVGCHNAPVSCLHPRPPNLNSQPGPLGASCASPRQNTVGRNDKAGRLGSKISTVDVFGTCGPEVVERSPCAKWFYQRVPVDDEALARLGLRLRVDIGGRTDIRGGFASIWAVTSPVERSFRTQPARQRYRSTFTPACLSAASQIASLLCVYLRIAFTSDWRQIRTLIIIITTMAYSADSKQVYRHCPNI